MKLTHLPTHSDDRKDFAVFEGVAILHYLTKHYDPENRLSFDYNSDDYSVSEQWIAWQHGGVGPMCVFSSLSFFLFFVPPSQLLPERMANPGPMLMISCPYVK